MKVDRDKMAHEQRQQNKKTTDKAFKAAQIGSTTETIYVEDKGEGQNVIMSGDGLAQTESLVDKSHYKEGPSHLLSLAMTQQNLGSSSQSQNQN